MQMGSDGADGHAEGVGDLVIAALLLMIEDEDGSLDLTEALELLFDRLLELARVAHPGVETGRFGAHMKIQLVNDGPVTFWLDTG